ncbi:MAG TPA: heme-binding protein [Gemmatimonadaceae bacterium]|nr:heme-binding protein [Gemmatimonadaceae bacterium]
MTAPTSSTPARTTPPSSPPSYGPPISLALAKQVMAAAEAAAQERGWPMAIAIVDSTGHLVLFHRCDQAQHGSIVIAQAKAETAVNFRRPTKVFEDAVAAGGLGLRLLASPGLLPLDGGLPLYADGRIIGAIGVSGMQSTQDAEIAQIGVAALDAAT